MSGDHDAFKAIGMPRTDQIGNSDSLAVHRVLDREGLLDDFGPFAFEVIGDELRCFVLASEPAGRRPRSQMALRYPYALSPLIGAGFGAGDSAAMDDLKRCANNKPMPIATATIASKPHGPKTILLQLPPECQRIGPAPFLASLPRRSLDESKLPKKSAIDQAAIVVVRFPVGVPTRHESEPARLRRQSRHSQAPCRE